MRQANRKGLEQVTAPKAPPVAHFLQRGPAFGSSNAFVPPMEETSVEVRAFVSLQAPSHTPRAVLYKPRHLLVQSSFEISPSPQYL